MQCILSDTRFTCQILPIESNSNTFPMKLEQPRLVSVIQCQAAQKQPFCSYFLSWYISSVQLSAASDGWNASEISQKKHCSGEFRHVPSHIGTSQKCRTTSTVTVANPRRHSNPLELEGAAPHHAPRGKVHGQLIWAFWPMLILAMRMCPKMVPNYIAI